MRAPSSGGTLFVGPRANKKNGQNGVERYRKPKQSSNQCSADSQEQEEKRREQIVC